MSRQIRRLALVTALLAACATWPHTECLEESPKAGTLLDAIERLVEIYKPREQRAIREAVFVCRENAHSGSQPAGPLAEEEHCAFLVAAYRSAFKKEWGRCLANLQHGDGLSRPDDPGPSYPYTDTWPDVPCGIFSAREMLEFIRVRLDGPGGLPPNDPLRVEISQRIAQCLTHPAAGLVLTPPQHCGKVNHAFAEAAKPDPVWAYVNNELEHMP